MKLDIRPTAAALMLVVVSGCAGGDSAAVGIVDQADATIDEGSSEAASGTPAQTESPPQLTRGSDQPPVPMIAADRLYATGRDAATTTREARSPLSGWVPPVAAPGPSGRHVVYSAWRELREVDSFLSLADQGISEGDPLAVPEVRLIDREDGYRDRLLVEGGFGAVWRGDGALGYVAGVEPAYRAETPYVGHIVVRNDVDASPTRWTKEPNEYITIGWAGKTLLAYVQPGHEGKLVAFDGPGAMRELPSGDVTAFSPDGSYAVVSGRERGRATVEVVAVADGRVVASLDQSTPGVAGEPLEAVEHSGDWVGDRIVASARTATEPSVLAVLQFNGTTLRVAQTLSLPTSQVPVGFWEARFVEGSDRVAATYAIPPEVTEEGYAGPATYRFVDCELSSQRCTWGQPATDGPLFMVRNSSGS